MSLSHSSWLQPNLSTYSVILLASASETARSWGVRRPAAAVGTLYLRYLRFGISRGSAT
jgi:hypothetical protein